MTQDHVILDAPDQAPRRRPAVRLAVWCLLTLCATLAALVILSDPNMGDRVGNAAGAIKARIGLTETAAAPAATGLPVMAAPGVAAARAEAARPPAPVAAEPSERPAVRVLPQSRIPVRRAGLSGDG